MTGGTRHLRRRDGTARSVSAFSDATFSALAALFSGFVLLTLFSLFSAFATGERAKAAWTFATSSSISIPLAAVFATFLLSTVALAASGLWSRGKLHEAVVDYLRLPLDALSGFFCTAAGVLFTLQLAAGRFIDPVTGYETGPGDALEVVGLSFAIGWVGYLSSAFSAQPSKWTSGEWFALIFAAALIVGLGVLSAMQ